MGRTPCCDKNGLKKGPWTPEEDQKLIDYIQKHGYGNWRTLPKNAGLQRCGKSCRLRWTNYLRPDIKRGRFSFEEEETIIQLHRILGNKWSAIAARLPGRTDNEIKNYWNTHIRKRLLRMGIDPVTHSPRLDLLDLSSILGTSLYSSSSSPAHQINLSRFLGLQPLVNPEILRLASSLMASQHENNQLCNNIPQYFQNQQVHHQMVQTDHNQQLQNQNPLQDFPSTSTFSAPNYVDHQLPNLEQFSSGVSNHIVSRSSHLDNQQQWQNINVPEDHYASLQNCDFYASSDQSNQNFSFPSLLSPSSSPTPLNSNSTTYNNINSSSTEDEIESYCSNLMKFEIPADFLDVTEFM